MKGRDHIKSDERVLGDSDFIDSVLSQAGEHYDRRYELKRRDDNLNLITEKVAEIYNMDSDEIRSKGKQKIKVRAWSLLCF